MNLTVDKSTGVLEPAVAPQSSLTATAKPPSHTSSLPEKPLVVIEPSKSWVPLDLHDLWTYRELLYFLAWRDLKVRYKQTVLGIAWVVMQPLLTTLIFTIFLGRLARVPSDGIHYPVFAYAGLLLWTFFSGAVAITSNSLVGNAHLLTKVYFPRLIIPGAAIAARLVDFAIAFLFLVGFMIYYDVPLTWSVLMLPVPIVLVTLLALGLGMLTSALNVKYRDVGAVLPILIQIGMFASPVLYSSSLVPAEWRWAYTLNPLVGIIESFRAALFGQTFNWAALAISTVTTFSCLFTPLTPSSAWIRVLLTSFDKLMKPIIKVENLSKQYRIGTRQASYTTLRELISRKARAQLKRLRNNGLSGDEMVWSLKDVSFEVQPGEVVGIIGRNGAGKSTLLKILSRITEPTIGRVELYGRVGSLLEVGTGFHPELTGRENIYLNGAIIGIKRAEIGRKFDEIVAFSEIEKFIDTPVKHYSSGMYTRLAFAVAAHMEPEILLVDEVLAVGDAAFQKKCLGKMGEVAGEGRTILFVSHNVVAIQALCDRSIFLDEGRLIMDGTSPQVVLRYLGQSAEHRAVCVWEDVDKAPGNDLARLQRVSVLDSNGAVASEISPDEAFTIEVAYQVKQAGAKLGATVVLFNQQGVCVFSSLSNHEPRWHGRPRPIGDFRSLCYIPQTLLADGHYKVTILLWEGNYRLVCREDDVVGFDVTDSGKWRGDYFGGWSGVVRPTLQWSTEQLESAETRCG